MGGGGGGAAAAGPGGGGRQAPRPRPPCASPGDKPHAGFPEAAYSENAEKLARAGLKVGARSSPPLPLPLPLPLLLLLLLPPPCQCHAMPCCAMLHSCCSLALPSSHPPPPPCPHTKQVVVIEQTETPDMLAIRNEQRKRQGLKRVGRGAGRAWRLSVCGEVLSNRQAQQQNVRGQGCLQHKHRIYPVV